MGDYMSFDAAPTHLFTIKVTPDDDFPNTMTLLVTGICLWMRIIPFAHTLLFLLVEVHHDLNVQTRLAMAHILKEIGIGLDSRRTMRV
jgi:hypothetical protein